jgi:hypothetical protein
MRLYPRGVLALCVSLALYPGCSTTNQCGAIAAIAPVITITNADSGQPICDATVVAQCGDAGATLVAFGPNGYEVDATVPGCQYGVGLLNACDGAATIQISKAGYRSVSVPNVATRFSAHCPGPIPDPQRVSVALEPD